MTTTYKETMMDVQSTYPVGSEVEITIGDHIGEIHKVKDHIVYGFSINLILDTDHYHMVSPVAVRKVERVWTLTNSIQYDGDFLRGIFRSQTGARKALDDVEKSYRDRSVKGVKRVDPDHMTAPGGDWWGVESERLND